MRNEAINPWMQILLDGTFFIYLFTCSQLLSSSVDSYVHILDVAKSMILILEGSIVASVEQA
jgi:hypothetical protein